jgi:hypothetical protein
MNVPGVGGSSTTDRPSCGYHLAYQDHHVMDFVVSIAVNGIEFML